VRTPISLRNEGEQEAFRTLGADVAVVVAYGLLLPKPILDGTRLGAFNGHASLLPRWRGAAPINRAIMAGDEETGVAVMQMDQGLETGPVALEQEIKIAPDMTAGELHDKLSEAGADLIMRALAALSTTGLQFTPQESEGVTYAKKIDKNETRIDWSKPERDVHNHIRGLSPFPGAWFEIAGAKPLRVRALRSMLAEGKGKPGEVLDGQLTIACGEGAIKLMEVQRAGAKAMSAEEFLRGFQTKPAALS
jgi:methionyl-tRNA formyltransferase